MQNSKLILVSSLAALALCAVPYGCSGKYVSSDPMGARADGKSTGCCGEGTGQSSYGNSGITDGAYSPPRGGDGSVFVDGAYSPPRGDGSYVEGYEMWGDGYGGLADGEYPDGSPIEYPDGGYADGIGAYDGWDGLGEGVASYTEGQADGSP